MTNKGAGYLRKSTFGTDEDGVERQEGSFERQKALILDYAQRNNIEVVKWYVEPVTGKSIRKRKVFLRMVKDALSPGRLFDHIIFGEYDRFMRHGKEGMRYEVALDDARMKLHFTNLKNDGSTADQIYKAVVRETSAEFSKDLSRRVVQGMYRKAKMGSWLGGVPPYGYRREKKPDGMILLRIVPEEAKIVRMIFRSSLQGKGAKSIAFSLNQKGIPASEAARKRNNSNNRNVDGKWTGETIRMLLRNPVYKGVLRWNRRARVDCFDWKFEGRGTVEVGKLRTDLPEFNKSKDYQRGFNGANVFIDREKPKQEWVLVPGAVPAIVEPNLFDEVQANFRTNKSHKWRRPNHIKYFLASALRCRTCGNNLSGHRYHKFIKEKKSNVFYYYYRCSGDVRKGTHLTGPKKPMLTQESIDSVVMDGIKSRLVALIDSSNVKRMLRGKISEFNSANPDRLTKITDEITRVEKEMDRLIFAHAKLERPLPETEVDQLKSRCRELESERVALQAVQGATARENVDKQIDAFLEEVYTVGTIIDKGTPEEKREVRETFLASGEVDWYTDTEPTRVELYWRKIPQFTIDKLKSTSTFSGQTCRRGF